MGFLPLHSMELVFSQRADLNRAKPANAQDHARNARRLLTGKFEALEGMATFTIR